jgi:2-keto-4-pentenoate hydratase/2-oxohepta-3-ene-1,7-dioic acid hydratase in catechol pathway
MKLVTFDEGRTGRIDGDTVVELDCGSTREYFERGGDVGETGECLPLASVRLRAPIVPKKFFHTAGNFTEHHEELARVNWSHPVHKGIVFFQNVDAIIGPDDPVIYPEHLTRELDYELELAIIIGKSGKFLAPTRPRTTSPAEQSSTTSPPATSSAGRCGRGCSRSARPSTRSARSARRS